MNKDDFVWVAFYTEFAEKLLPYANNRTALIEKIKAVYAAISMPLPKLEKDNQLVDIDPFTIFGLFNKGITDANRTAILNGIAAEFSVQAPVPHSFRGVPVLNNQKATFYYFLGERKEGDIDTLWKVFVSAMEYAQSHAPDSKAALVKAYDAAILQKGVKWNLTMGLYWICPYEYINLDSRSRWYIRRPESRSIGLTDCVGNLNSVPSGEAYLEISDRCHRLLAEGKAPFKNFP